MNDPIDEILKDTPFQMKGKCAKCESLRERLVTVQETRDAVWEYASGCSTCHGKEADLLNKDREPDCAECEVPLKIVLDLDKALNGEQE
jgi:cytochrome c553